MIGFLPSRGRMPRIAGRFNTLSGSSPSSERAAARVKAGRRSPTEQTAPLDDGVNDGGGDGDEPR